MKNGFSLIELLSVIVILAFISLIATPIVLNIIKNTKESSELNSVILYLDSVKYSVAEEIFNRKGLSSGKFFIMPDGNLCLTELEDGICQEESVLKLDVDGIIPNSGYITMEDGDIKEVSIKLNEKIIIKNNKGELIYLPKPDSFEKDSWDIIIANIKAGNLSKYKIGDEKEIELTGFTNLEKGTNGKNKITYTVRIANKSTPEECYGEGFSQTACGFIIEFVDIITKNKMNSTATSVGGWEDCFMREFVNDKIYNALPDGLKVHILDTYVVSGHESGKSENYKTIDKLYLLAPKEVYGSRESIDSLEETRQLDYYRENGVTKNNYSRTIKTYNGTSDYWWLRSARSNYTNRFFDVRNIGVLGNVDSNSNYGVIVAFRL